MWNRFRHLVKRVFRSSELDRTLDAEMQSYVAHDIEQRVRAGAAPWEARRLALAEFGSADGVRESVRDGRTAAWVDGLRQDLRYAVRALAKSPGFSFAIIGSLALGMAAMVTTTAFVNALLFRSFPGVADPETLVEVRLSVAEGRNWDQSTTLPEYQLLRERLKSVKSLAATANATKVAISVPAARSTAALFVSENYFDVLGTPAVIGRTFTQEDARPEALTAAVVSYALWQTAFTGDPAVIGRTIGLGDRVATVIGVMPRGFGGVGQSFGSAGPELWLPLAQIDAIGREMPGWLSPPPRGQRYLRFVARMSDPSSLARVRSEANVLAWQIGAARIGLPLTAAAEAPNAFAEVVPLRMVDVSRMAPLMALVMLVPAVVLLIACVNAANLLLARASQRAREIAVRLAIGASRRRLIRQCLVESLVLAGASSVCAVPAAWMVLRALESTTGIVMPLDGRVLAFTLVTAGISAVCFGLVPAFRATNRPPARALTASQTSDGTPQRTRGRRALVIVQVALSLGLLTVGAHLIAAIKSGDRAGGTDPDRLILATFDLNQVRVAPGAASQFYQRLLDRVSQLPDVEAVGVAPERAVWTIRYGKQPDNSSVVWRPGAPRKSGSVVLGGYTGGRFLDALGVRVLEGRGFTEADHRGATPAVAVVNDAFVRDVLKGPAVGQRVNVTPYVKWGGPAAPAAEVEIVGVVESAREPTYTNRDGGAVAGLYYPVPLQDQAALALYIRTRGPAAPTVPELRAAFSQVDARVPPLKLETLAEMNASLRRVELMMSRAAAILGVIALLLATAGLYAVVSYMVASRSSEIAVRMALGAEPGTMLRMVLRQALTMTAIGGVIGGAVAWAIGRGIQAEMHAAAGTDFKALGGAIAVLLLATLVAAALPSLRAARINPVVLLKE